MDHHVDLTSLGVFVNEEKINKCYKNMSNIYKKRTRI
jgi:hypothetical protein